MDSIDILRPDMVDDIPRRRSSILFPSQVGQFQADRRPSQTISITNPEIDDSLQEYTIRQNKLNDKLLKFKVNQLKKIFVNKLKRSACINQPPKIFRKRKYKQLINKVKIFETIQHIIVIAHLVALCTIFLLTAWTATINEFAQGESQTDWVIILKFVCLFIMVCQEVSNFIGISYLYNKQMMCTMQNLRYRIFRYATAIYFVKIIMLIFFCAFPTSQAYASIYFIFIAFVMLTGMSQISDIEAVYAYTLRLSFIWKLAKIIFTNLIYIHIAATILLGVSHANDQQNWLIANDLASASWHYKYISSFYWATVTIVTIGYGDLSAVNQVQKITVSFLALFSCILLAFNISEFSNVFGDLRNSYDSVRQKLVTFRRILKRDHNNNVKINPNVKKKIQKYLHHHLGSDNTELTFIQKNQFLQGLPSYLKHQYYFATNINLFSSIGFMKQLKLATLSALIEKFNVIFLEKGELIADSNSKIVILQEGLIGLNYHRPQSSYNGKTLDQIRSGRGENIQLLTYHFLNIYKQQNYKMSASNYSIIWTINIEDFVEIIEKDVIDFQYYFNVYHKFPLDQCQWENKICRTCSIKQNKQFHNAFECPKLSYMPLRSLILQKNLYCKQIFQKRTHFERNKTKAPRISVIKYWNKYLKKNHELVTKRNEAHHLHNVAKKKIKILSYKKSYNLYLQRQKMNILAEARYLNYVVDIGFNFQFYMTKFNPQNLLFTPVTKLIHFESCVVEGILRNVLHVKGSKFNFKQVDF